MTMANATSSTQRPSPSASLRKTNKPLMEKRRRARINDSLTQLKALVMASSKKDSSTFNKLEKADILELTVNHLRDLQTKQHQHQQMSQTIPQDPNPAGKYRAGFLECANEVMRFLKQSQGFNDETKTRVVGHLADCLQISSQSSFNNRPTAAATIVQQNAVASRLNAPNVAPSSATTAHLVNGQIIQIVNAPFQHNQQASLQQAAPAAVLVATSSLPSAAVAPMQQHIAPAQTVSTSKPSISLPQSQCQSSAPQKEQSSYNRYCQPLHIQIPPTVSPVLVKDTKPQQQQIVTFRNEERVPMTHSAETMDSSSPPSPSPKDLSPPPKPAAYKHLDFYAPTDIHNDYPQRCRTFSMTSSSSSSESEMTSPLNLSQSPPFASYEQQKELARPFSTKAVNFSDIYSKISFKQQNVQLPQQVSCPTDNSNSTSPSNFTSVIVNTRKALDIPSAKYMRMMMEEERQCARPQGTPSPASSMGEERLWRPW